MVNVFTLGTIFTSLELALYLLFLIGSVVGFHLKPFILVYLVIAIVCFIPELNGIRKKHYELSLFSVAFRSIQVICLIIFAIMAIIAVSSKAIENIDEFQELTPGEKKIAKKIAVIITAVSFDECKV